MQVQLRFGHFVMTAAELGLQTSATKVGSHDAVGDIGVFGACHLGEPGTLMVPCIGAQVGTGFGFPAGNPFTFGGFGGLKYFLGQSGAISPEVFSARSTRDNLAWTAFGVRVGVSVFFGGR